MKIVARSVFTLALVCLLLCTFLLGSRTGLQLIKKSLLQFSGGGISVGEVEGRLLGRLTLEKIHIVTSGTDIRIEKFAWDWSPTKLFQGEFRIASLYVSGVVIGLGNSPAAPSAGGPMVLPKLLLPLGFAIDRAAVVSFKIQDSAGDELIAFDNIDVEMEGRGGHLSIGNISLQGPEIGLAVHGTVDFDRNWHVDLLGNWRLVNYGFNQLEGTLSATGPLASLHATFGVNSPADIRVEGDVVNLLDNPEWTATLLARDVDLEALIKHCPKIDLATVSGQLSGNTDGYGGQVQAVGAWGTMDKLQLQTNITAGLLGIDFETLRIDHGDSWIVAEKAKINWKRLFDWEGLFHVRDFNPSAFFDWLPGRISGDLTSVGTVRDDLGVDIAFEIFRLDGELREQPISAVGNIAVTENDVRTDGLTIRSGEVEGSARIEKGMFSWADKLSWSGEIRLQNFDPARIYPDFPGQVSGFFAGEGFIGSDGTKGYLKISDITGNLRGSALSGNGEIRLSGETIQTSGLFLQSGSSQLVVQGQAGEDFALDFKFNSPDLGTIIPESSGALMLLGKLRGSFKNPLLDIEAHGQGLGMGDNRFSQLEAKIHSEMGEDDRLKGSFLGGKMILGGLPIDQAQIDFSGSFEEQDVKVQAGGDFGRLQFRAEALRRDRWMGEISSAHLASSSYGNWRQQDSADFSLGKDGVVLEDFCIAEDEGTLCVGGYVQSAEKIGWRVKSRFSAISLNWLNRLKLIAVPVNGLFAGEIAASGEDSRLISAQAEVRLPETDFELEDVKDEEFNSIHCEDTVLSLVLADALLQTNLVSRMKNGSQLTINAATRGADLFAVPVRSLPLSGSLGLQNFDLAILSALTGYSVDPTGRMSSYFTLGGTVGRPELAGEGRIEGGGITLPFQGITLGNVRVAITAAVDGAKVLFQATSGEGEIRAEGDLHYGDEGLEGDLHIGGNNFLLLDLPEYVIRVNPDMQFLFARNQARVKGSVKIPYAMLTPEEMKDSVQVSQDVILVNGRQEVKGSGWPFALDLNVLLGDEVSIKGYGLTGRLSGQLHVKTEPDEFPTAIGELDLTEGVFTIYGRTLDIERGRVLFTGGPIENPGVDVRAQKKFSEEQAKNRGYTVGVDISGLAQDLSYHLFSDPYMDDTEILSQMIVGRSLAFSNNEDVGLLEAAATTLGVKGSEDLFKGVGNILQLDDMHLEGSSQKENVSLVVGKRVTKELYIGYDMNMFSQLGQFRVRYDLTRGFAVETRSSSQSTGADLLFSFEK
ncbi:MAG: translocation/assembly module TamB domain-containing protein [Proteobacteria bacterium]|nr:translocation/assembly module TamB domain-containing protein [Pseudomonadota bacterium]